MSRKSLRENASWSNPHAEMASRINGTDIGKLIFKDEQPGDKAYGPVTEVTLRTLGYLYHLNKQSLELQSLLLGEHELSRRERLLSNTDEIEIEIGYVLGLYFLQLHMEKELQAWRGPPIFTIRSDGQAVIREKDLRAYSIHATELPYVPAHTHEFFRSIALASIKGERH